jgi:hypothetical protein
VCFYTHHCMYYLVHTVVPIFAHASHFYTVCVFIPLHMYSIYYRTIGLCIGIEIHCTPASLFYTTQNCVCFYTHYSICTILSTYSSANIRACQSFLYWVCSNFSMYSIYYRFYNGCDTVCLMYSIY